MPTRSPTAQRRRLGMELRRLREEAGLTIDQVAKSLDCSDSKISRIETAQVGATWRDVRDVLEIYGVSARQRDELIQVAREARQKGWWQAYGSLPFEAFVGLEAAAVSIRMYAALVIPGLFQTEEYAQAVVRAIRPDLQQEEIDRRIDVRMARQALLTQDDPTGVWGVLDEAVLRRLVGHPDLGHQQLHRLIEVAALPNITLQVLPFHAGLHAGMDGAFIILGFREPASPPVVYLENTTSDDYLEDLDAVNRYVMVFDHLRAAALGTADSVAFLTGMAKEL